MCLSSIHTPANGDPWPPLWSQVPEYCERGHIQETGPLQEAKPREETCVGPRSGCRAIFKVYEASREKGPAGEGPAKIPAGVPLAWV